jgi:hypothetical protein
MVNKPKIKGTQFEVDCRDYLRQWWNVERLPTEGKNDRGDLVGVPGFTIECKAVQRLAVPQWLRELDTEKKNAGTDGGFVIVKYPRHSVDVSWTAMRLCDMVNLLLRLEQNEQPTGSVTSTNN